MFFVCFALLIMLVNRWFAIWKTRKWIVLCVAVVLLFLLALQNVSTQVVVIAEASDGGRTGKSYRGEAPLVCAAFVAERGHPSRLLSVMSGVFAKLRSAPRGFWEAAFVALSRVPARSVDTIKKRFAVDVFVASKVARGRGWPVLAAVMGACRAPYVLLMREDSVVTFSDTQDLNNQIARLKRDDRAVGVYLEAHDEAVCSGGKCKAAANSYYSGSVVLDRTKLVSALPVALEKHHTLNDLIEKAGMHFLEV